MTSLANFLFGRKRICWLTHQEAARLASMLMPVWSPLKRLYLKQVCKAWKEVFEQEHQARLAWELRKYRDKAMAMPDPQLGLLMIQCISCRRPAWMRATVLSAFHRVCVDFAHHIEDARFSVVKIPCTSPINGELLQVPAVVLPRRDFAYALWSQCGLRADSGENVPQEWNPLTILVPHEYYVRWQDQQQQNFAKTILPWIMGIQAYLPLHPRAVSNLRVLNHLNVPELIAHVKKGQRRHKYDMDLCHYIMACESLIQDYKDEDLIPDSILTYMNMWFVWRDIEEAISLVELKRAKDNASTLAMYTARLDRFTPSLADDQMMQRSSSPWWSILPRLMCISPSSAELTSIPAITIPPAAQTPPLVMKMNMSKPLQVALSSTPASSSSSSSSSSTPPPPPPAPAPLAPPTVAVCESAADHGLF